MNSFRSVSAMECNTGLTQQGLYFNQPTWIGCPSCSCWVLYYKHAANGILTCQTCRNSSDEDEMNSFRISSGGANRSWPALPPQKDATSQRPFKVGSQAASGSSILNQPLLFLGCLNKEVADESRPNKNTEHVDAKINKHGHMDSSKRNSKKRKMASESSESCDSLEDDGNNLTGNNLGGFGKRYPRRYIRSKMCVSCSEPLNPSCNGEPVSVEIPESEFYNFDADKSKEKFQVGQIWAVYSDEDVLPKYYCQIKKIDSLPENTYHVAWLLHCPSSRDMVRWVDKSIPICCGKFMVEKGKTHKIVGTLPFSHQLKIEPSPLEKEGVFTILPEVGQIWACYENWNVKMKLAELENCKYEIVEILDVDDISIVCAPLDSRTTLFIMFQLTLHHDVSTS
ncbi:unnamed protein product [Fraxinus pennsylvanica]|uniref:DUF3444 domain-containing protein n=1 Tax=Fraxinus pennsylvanica TaxID=56036 RepID=A0AAD1Z0Z3_9LAMI|nr:unnamed protein product [Fraxinus pennsylvanica]